MTNNEKATMIIEALDTIAKYTQELLDCKLREQSFELSRIELSEGEIIIKSAIGEIVQIRDDIKIKRLPV